MGAALGSAFSGIVGGFFLYEGVQCISGKVPSTVGIAVGSILLAGGLAFYGMGFTNLTDTVLSLVTPAGLIVAGILALIGRGQYEEWHRHEHRQRQQARVMD